MKSATFRIQNPLLDQLHRIKPKSKSFSAFVREALMGLVKKHQMLAAARQYNDFLENHDEEASWLEEWESADLASHPAPALKNRKKPT
jgi:hypothetical protein